MRVTLAFNELMFSKYFYFQNLFPFLYIPKTSYNLWFSDIFRGIKTEQRPEMGLNSLTIRINLFFVIFEVL